MHEKLAEELNLESFRRIKTLSVETRKGKPIAPWLDGAKVASSLMDGGKY